MIIDHEIAMTIIGGFGGAAMAGGSPKNFIVGAIFSALTLGPIMYWLKLQGNRPGQMNRPANIYYTDDVTKDEIERFTHQDNVEMLAF